MNIIVLPGLVLAVLAAQVTLAEPDVRVKGIYDAMPGEYGGQDDVAYQSLIDAVEL